MCVLAIWIGMDSAAPLVVGANRDEAYARPSAPPAEIEPGIIAGRDLQSGGTWLGVRQDGLLVAVTNRRTPAWAPGSASRGILVVEALRCGSLREIENLTAQRVGDNAYGGFNLVAILNDAGICLQYDGSMRPVGFGPGRHVVSSDYNMNAASMPEKDVFDRFCSEHQGVPDDASLRTFLSSHEGARPICKHGAAFGTVSSTIITIGARGQRVRYADGPPCTTAFGEVPATFASR